MYTSQLYDELLFKPLKKYKEINKIAIVSGYATAAMAFRHLNDLRQQSKNINIELIVGMTSKDGLTLSNHNGFKKLVEDEFPKAFECNYIVNTPPVHSKIYVLCSNSSPIIAYTGSANYTQSAFCLNSIREVMTNCDPETALEYFNSLQDETIICNHSDAEQFITIYRDSIKRREYQAGITDQAEYDIDDYSDLPSITVSLLDRTDNLPTRSGLNWGQRPEQRREPNQAYIRLTSDIYKGTFFPPVSVHFTLFTDDGKTLICTRAQDNGKAIHTPHNNSLIGEYFRNRLGVPNGEPVLKEHLLKHGRTDITFYKIDDETYYMDFSPKTI